MLCVQPAWLGVCTFTYCTNLHCWVACEELAFIIVGSSVQEDSFWNMEHLSSKIKAQASAVRMAAWHN